MGADDENTATMLRLLLLSVVMAIPAVVANGAAVDAAGNSCHTDICHVSAFQSLALIHLLNFMPPRIMLSPKPQTARPPSGLDGGDEGRARQGAARVAPVAFRSPDAG